MTHRILRRRIAMPTFIAALACLAAAHAADGDLDAAFDGNGLLRIPTVPDNTDGAEAMLLAAGKHVVAGYAHSTRGDIGIVRLQSGLIFADGLE